MKLTLIYKIKLVIWLLISIIFIDKNLIADKRYDKYFYIMGNTKNIGKSFFEIVCYMSLKWVIYFSLSLNVYFIY
jgi:cell shape-determining protein MreC